MAQHPLPAVLPRRASPRPSQVKALAESFAKSGKKLHILVNNAGAMVDPRRAASPPEAAPIAGSGADRLC